MFFCWLQQARRFDSGFWAWDFLGSGDTGAIPLSFLAHSTDLQRRLGVFADVQVSAEVSGPVTFGFLRPVILLPEACLRDASIACHELVHVRRRDWLFA